MLQHGCICLLSICHAREIINSSGSQQLQDDPCGAVVAWEGVVPRPSRVGGGRTRSDLLFQPVGRQFHWIFPLFIWPPGKDSFVLQEWKFSSVVSHNIFTALGPSTSVVYQHWWSVYVGWCRANMLSAPCPSLHLHVSFFSIIREEKNFAIGSIWGYGSTLHSLLRHTGLHI